MADFEKVAEHYPAIRDFRHNDLFGFRGDVLSYHSSVVRPSFSTDAQGFRHSTLGGKTYSVVDCISSPRYGLALGPSTFFCSGVAGNENTLPSLLAERFGFPIANASTPGGNSRNLHALLVGLLAGAKQPPAVVLWSNADLANFCEAGSVDPIFGSPNHVQLLALQAAPPGADLEAEFRKLLVFTRMWTSATASLCKARNIPLVFVHPSTFFEKTKPTAVELETQLGRPTRESQKKVLTNFAAFNERFLADRIQLTKQLDIPLARVQPQNRLEFIDEFHLTADSLKLLSEAVGDAAAPLVGGPKRQSAKTART